MSIIVENICLSFNGLPLVPLPLEPSRWTGVCGQSRNRLEARDMFLAYGGLRARDAECPYLKPVDTPETAFTHCHGGKAVVWMFSDEPTVKSRERFKACKKCSAIGRTVLYCSRCVHRLYHRRRATVDTPIRPAFGISASARRRTGGVVTRHIGLRAARPFPSSRLARRYRIARRACGSISCSLWTTDTTDLGSTHSRQNCSTSWRHSMSIANGTMCLHSLTGESCPSSCRRRTRRRRRRCVALGTKRGPETECASGDCTSCSCPGPVRSKPSALARTPLGSSWSWSTVSIWMTRDGATARLSGMRGVCARAWRCCIFLTNHEPIGALFNIPEHSVAWTRFGRLLLAKFELIRRYM